MGEDKRDREPASIPADPANTGERQEAVSQGDAPARNAKAQPISEKKKRGKSRKKRHILRNILLVLLALLLIGLAAGYAVIKPQYDQYQTAVYEKLAGMSRSDFSMRTDTEIFDSSGNRLGLINAGHYEYVSISEISQNIQDAYIAQEDKRFLTHHGVDWLATARAALKLVQNRGKITQGGSTITQQVVKNTFLTQEQTFSRKIIEILMAPEIEKKYTKADIMEFYCNTNYYGNHCYGVQAASRYYFGKDAAELSVPEAALLAGVSNSPGRYDPVKHPQEAKEKRNRVMASMAEEGYLTEAEYQQYSATPLVIVQDTQEGTDETYQTSYALHCAALTLMKLDGFVFQYVFETQEEYEEYLTAYDEAYADKSSDLRGGGYKIYTSLDSEIQATVQQVIDDALSPYTELQENGKFALQGAGVIVDNRTGYVVAAVGGRGTEDHLNRAYNAARQPGSCIKPLLDYGPAFDTGEYYPARMVNDHKWENGPKNSGGSYYGDVTVRFALNKSLNTVAWQVLEDIGIGTGLSYLGEMQFQKLSWVDASVPAISIGGFTNGVRVVDMAKGFSALANGGLYSDRTCIVRIEQQDLGDITANLAGTKTQVYREDSAWMLTDVLKGSFTDGTAGGLALDNDMPCAGKTGTANDSKDTWFCGYTKYYTGAFWVGYDTPRSMPGVYGSTYAGKMWQTAMNKLHEGLPPIDFAKPQTVEERTDETTGLTDWRSTTDEERAAETLHKKEQEKEREELTALVIDYEQHTLSRLDDIAALDAMYAEIMNRAGLLDESDERTELLERTETRKRELDETEAGLGGTLTLWRQQKQREEEELKALRESEAEESRREETKRVNRQEVQDAVDAVYTMSYQCDELTELVNTAIAKLSLVSGYADESEYTAKVDAAVRYANSLPTEEIWQQQEAAKKAAAQSVQDAAERRTAAQQQALSDSYQPQKETTASTGADEGEVGPGVNLP